MNSLKVKTGVLLICLLTTMNCSSVSQLDLVAGFTVHAGENTRFNSPVSIDISELPVESLNDYQLVEITGQGTEITPAQMVTIKNKNHLWWILSGETPAGSQRKYALREAASALALETINAIDSAEAIHLNIAEKRVLAYHYGLTPVPEGVSEDYRRGGYIHPLWSPEGAVLTRIQPPDHYHHYGIWNPWTHTEFEGKEVDFWNLNKKQGTVIVKKPPVTSNGPVFTNIIATHQYIVQPDSLHENTRPALDEIWEIRVWNADPKQTIWLVDIISTMTCATKSPLTIKKYRYQGFSIRATEHWNDNNTIMVTSEGKNKADGNATRARWIDVRGPSVAGTSGITFMTNPDNFNYPEQLRIWPVGANDGKENVFVNFNPAQDRDWELVTGKSYILKYRMLVYDGSMESSQIENYWNDYVNPPLVTKDEPGG